jgi:hypothetical protein
MISNSADKFNWAGCSTLGASHIAAGVLIKKGAMRTSLEDAPGSHGR